MASLSPTGERAVLALLAEQYAEIVELRIALSNERRRVEQLESEPAVKDTPPERD